MPKQSTDRVRIEIRLDPKLAKRLDQARGDVPTATFIRRLIERAVDTANRKRSAQ